MDTKKTLPAGYFTTTMNRGNQTTWIVIRESDREWIVRGQDSEQMAICRAAALIEGKPIDFYLK